MILVCEQCGRTSEIGNIFVCPKCKSHWRIQYSTKDKNQFEDSTGIWKYSASLPISNWNIKDPLVGSTPLVDLSSTFGRGNILFKDETRNPTQSYKDRGLIVGANRALEDHFLKWFVSSSGNAAHSAAYFAQKVGASCWVELPEGSGIASICEGLGAKVTFTNDRFEHWVGRLYALFSNLITPDLLWRLAYFNKFRDIFARGWYPLQPFDLINPYIGEGYKTIAYEICDALGDAPDALFVPAISGNGFNGLYRGFREYLEQDRIKKLPKMIFSRPTGRFMVNSLLSATKASIKASKGFVVGYRQHELESALVFLRENDFSVSDYGASGLAALLRVVEEDKNFLPQKVVVLLTGRRK